MHFNSLSEFFAMGGYGFYVWFAFGVGFFCLTAITVATKMKTAKLLNELRQKQARDIRRQVAQKMENRL